MEADNIFNSYYEGQLDELNTVLKEHVSYYAESGDIVMLSRAFSYYGIVNLICSNDFFVSTLFKQISEEYIHAGDDPRIKASYARFLALYSSFLGRSEDTSKYYMDARLLYPQTDWYPDEAITLLESACWHYLFSHDDTKVYSILERLEVLNNYLKGYLSGDLILLHSISKKNNFIEINNASVLEKLKEQRSSMTVKILVSFISLRDALLKPDKSVQIYKAKALSQILGFPLMMQQNCPIIQLLEGMSELVDMIVGKNFINIDLMINAVKAKAEIFKHPWYKDQLLGLPSHFCGIKSNQSSSHGDTLPEDRHFASKISVNLFEKCYLSCRNTVFNLNSFGTRTGNELLLYLITQKNLQVHKEALVELFFPDEEPQKAFNRLYVNIHRLNKVLQKHFSFPGDSDFVFIKQGIVCINSDALEEVDTQKYRKMLSVANQLWINDKDAAIELIDQVIGMYSSDIAPGFYYLDWLDDYRLELKNMQLKALNRILQYYQHRDNPKRCLEAFHSLIELDSLNEEYYIEYIGYILKDGRDVEAVNLFNQYQTRLKKELELTPSLKLKNLMSRIMR